MRREKRPESMCVLIGRDEMRMAERLSCVTGLHRAAALGGLVAYWETSLDKQGDLARELWAADAEDREPEVLQRRDECELLARMSGLSATVEQMADVGIIEIVPEGVRLCGMEKYFDATRKRIALSERGRKGGAATAARRRLPIARGGA
jgi:hypothetical protein